VLNFCLTGLCFAGLSDMVAFAGLFACPANRLRSRISQLLVIESCVLESLKHKRLKR
jgi:hypothetical protein